MILKAAEGWKNTGYKPGSQRGLYVNIRSTGYWCCRTDDRPYGTREASGAGLAGRSKLAPAEGDTRFPYHGPGARMGQLLGKFESNGAPFVVGGNMAMLIQSVDADLTLYLGINFFDLSLCDGQIDVQFSVSDGILDKPPSEYYDRIARRWVQR